MSFRPIGTRGNLPKFEFYVRFKGQRHRHTVACPKSVVRDVYRDWEREIFSGSAVGRRRLFETLDEYIHWSKVQKREKMSLTEEHHCRLIKEFFGNKEMSLITRPNVLDFSAWNLAKGSSPATTNRAVATLRFIFNWAIERNYLIQNPASKVRLKGEIERVISLEEDQMREVLSATTASSRPWVFLAMLAGLRRGEVGQLTWNQIIFDQGVIRLSDGQTKSGKGRTIPIPMILLRFLEHQKSEHPEWPFVVGPKRQVANQAPWKSVLRRLPWAKAMGLRFHDLRHVYATYLRAKGVELSAIKEFMGHADMKQTMRYAHFNPERRDLVSSFDGILEWNAVSNICPTGKMDAIFDVSKLAGKTVNTDDSGESR